MCTMWDFYYSRCRHVTSELQMRRNVRNGVCPNAPPQNKGHNLEGDCGCGGDAKL